MTANYYKCVEATDDFGALVYTNISTFFSHCKSFMYDEKNTKLNYIELLKSIEMLKWPVITEEIMARSLKNTESRLQSSSNLEPDN